MGLETTISKIETLTASLSALGALKEKDKQRLWEKFRLEWNYNSNHIEGNTLTYGETMLLLVKGKTTGDHDKREYDEMEAHDLAVDMVNDWAKGKERPLSESDIRELNNIILVRPYYSPARTQDGTRKRIVPGKYKELPNHVLLPNGKIFRYAEPHEVPLKMQTLVDWYNTETVELHPLLVAAKFHHDFVLIHPFGDGNGRVARLIMNYHLLKNNYPPVVIKSVDKTNYLNALSKADAGDIESFANYIGKQLIWSLELKIKATKGESLEEQDDFDKKLELWSRKFKQGEKSIVSRSDELIYKLYLNSFKPFFEEFIQKTSKISSLFAKTEIRGKVNKSNADNMGIGFIDKELSRWEGKSPILGSLKMTSDFNNKFQSIGILIQFFAFKHAGTKMFDLATRLDIQFEEYKYKVTWIGGTFEALYTDAIPAEEKNKIIKKVITSLMARIDEQTSN